MSRRALVVWGGWPGHEPDKVARRFERLLKADGFAVDVADALDAFKNAADYALVVPIWTMGTIADEQVNPLLTAVRDGGVGLAGCHGGMCDAFRGHTEWQFMTGGQWVSHPGNDGVPYVVRVPPSDHELARGLGDFEVRSEQYYLHVDPAVKVWATTRFPVADGPHVSNGQVDMPVVWTKLYGAGRVFYNALGHADAVFDDAPTAEEFMRRGFRWAARAP